MNTQAIIRATNAAADLWLAAQGKAGKAQDAASKKRDGAYTHAVRTAIASEGEVSVFEAVCESMFDRIRSNVDGAAKQANASVAKTAGPNGEVQFTVPGAMSSARTYLRQAMEFNVSLTGDDGEPASFGSIRKAVDAAKAERDRANETPEQKRRREIADACATILANVGDMVGDQLTALHKVLTAQRSAILNANAAAKKAAKAAKAAERAAKGAAKAQSAGEALTNAAAKAVSRKRSRKARRTADTAPAVANVA